MSRSAATLSLKCGKQLFKLDNELLDACLGGSKLTAYELLKKGANPKNLEERIPEEDNVSPLHHAVLLGWYDIVKLFIDEYKCNPMIRDSRLQTPLHYACQNGCVDIAKLLIGTYKCDVNCQSKSGLTPLQVTQPRFHQLIKLLIQNEANPHVVDEDGNSLLHKACESFCLKSVKCLLEEGKCDPNFENKVGLTPIQVIYPKSGNMHIYTLIMRELVRHGANLNVVDKDGNTQLHKACENSNFERIEFLLQEGKCDPNVKNTAGLTPIQVHMQIASWYKSNDIILLRVLVQHGANPNVVDKDGNTPLHNVCEYVSSNPYLHNTYFNAYSNNCLQSIICLLEEGKCDPNIKNNAGLTPVQVISPRSSYIMRALVQRGANPNVVDNDGNTPLHKACKYVSSNPYSNVYSNYLQSITCLLEEGKCDPNIKNKDGLTPIQVISPESIDIMRALVQHGANPNVVDKDGNTPLHKACTHGYLQIVKCLLEEGKCDPNIKNKAGLTPIQVTSPDFPDIIRELIRHGARSTDAYQTFGNVLKNPKPLQPPVKVFIVGNPATGKSTLTESLKNESSQFFGRFLKVSGVDAKTAGINPHAFCSNKYGSVIFYDFAGHRSFYSSHAAVLRNTIQTSPIFIVVVDLIGKNEVIKQDLLFWLSLLSNQICSLENKPHVIVVGSHADKVNSRGEQAEQKMSRVIESLPPISDFYLVDAIPLDCRYPSSSGMTKLHQCLRESCDTLRIYHTINFNAHCFFIYLLDNFGKLIAVTVKEVKTKIKSNSDVDTANMIAFIPTTLQSLCTILDELNDRGHILYLKDHSNDENSWVIIDKAALLSEVTGTIFAPADFKQHCTLASSTGVVPLSNLSCHFPKHNIKMLVAFLYHLEFCREITDPEARTLIIEHHHSENSIIQQPHTDLELYFLFPGLIRLEAPEGIWETDCRFSHYFGWALQTQSGQFFTTRLLQVLILRLAFSFALAPDSKDVRSDVPAFQRKCSIWKNGIFWGDQFGVETLVELLPSNDAIILLMRSYDSNLTNVLLLRSKLIQKILGVAYEFCSRVDTLELIIDPSECNQYPLTLVNCYTQTVKAIAKAVTKETSHPAVVSSTGKTLLLEDFLIYEPYVGLGLSFLTDFFSDSSAERKISDNSLSMIAEHIPRSHGHEIVRRLLKENTSSDDHFIALKSWRDKRKATYQNLREILDQMSIFTGRNPLKLAGVESDIGVHEIETVEDTELEPKQDTELPAGGASLDLLNVTTALTDLLQWHELGLCLGIRKIKLDEIRIDYYPHGQSRQKSEMIDLWLCTDEDASWEKLRAALEQIGEFIIADEIRKQWIC